MVEGKWNLPFIHSGFVEETGNPMIVPLNLIKFSYFSDRFDLLPLTGDQLQRTLEWWKWIPGLARREYCVWSEFSLYAVCLRAESGPNWMPRGCRIRKRCACVGRGVGRRVGGGVRSAPRLERRAQAHRAAQPVATGSLTANAHETAAYSFLFGRVLFSGGVRTIYTSFIWSQPSAMRFNNWTFSEEPVGSSCLGLEMNPSRWPAPVNYNFRFFAT